MQVKPLNHGDFRASKFLHYLDITFIEILLYLNYIYICLTINIICFSFLSMDVLENHFSVITKFLFFLFTGKIDKDFTKNNNA